MYISSDVRSQVADIDTHGTRRLYVEAEFLAMHTDDELHSQIRWHSSTAIATSLRINAVWGPPDGSLEKWPVLSRAISGS